jgi:hypothetical protein
LLGLALLRSAEFFNHQPSDLVGDTPVPSLMFRLWHKTMDASRNNGTKTGLGNPPVVRRFQPGNPGRSKGSRNKLGKARGLADQLAKAPHHIRKTVYRVVGIVLAFIREHPDRQ